MKAVVAAFNQEKALVGALSVITNLRMELFEALLTTPLQVHATAVHHDQVLEPKLAHAMSHEISHSQAVSRHHILWSTGHQFLLLLRV